MTTMIREKLHEVQALCRKHGVVRLALFGSGLRDDFNEATSDLDFVVEFKPMNPLEHKDAYFQLLEDLDALFPVGVDLVEIQALTNPFVKSRIESDQETLYDVA